MHGSGQVEPASSTNFSEGYHAHRVSDDVADDHTEEDGAELEDTLAEVAQNGNNEQGQNGDEPVLGRTETFGARTACHVLDCGGIERQADGKDNGTGDEGREENADLLDKDAEQDGDDTADDLSAQDGGQVELSADGQKRGDIGETDTHDDGQTGTDAPENREQLEQGSQCGDEQGNLNEQGAICSLDAAGVGYQDGRGDDADDSRDNVLKSKRNELIGGGNSLVLEDRRRVVRGMFVHNGRLTIFGFDKKIFFAPISLTLLYRNAGKLSSKTKLVTAKSQGQNLCKMRIDEGNV